TASLVRQSGAQRIAGSDPDRSHLDPDRFRAAGGHHGGLCLWTQPDADDVGGFFVRARARLTLGNQTRSPCSNSAARTRFLSAPKRSNIGTRVPGEIRWPFHTTS